jgi:hypothetical protein
MSPVSLPFELFHHHSDELIAVQVSVFVSLLKPTHDGVPFSGSNLLGNDPADTTELDNPP